MFQRLHKLPITDHNLSIIGPVPIPPIIVVFKLFWVVGTDDRKKAMFHNKKKNIVQKKFLTPVTMPVTPVNNKENNEND